MRRRRRLFRTILVGGALLLFLFVGLAWLAFGRGDTTATTNTTVSLPPPTTPPPPTIPPSTSPVEVSAPTTTAAPTSTTASPGTTGGTAGGSGPSGATSTTKKTGGSTSTTTPVVKIGDRCLTEDARAVTKDKVKVYCKFAKGASSGAWAKL